MSIMDKISTRDAFGNALLRIAENDENVVAIAADTTKSMGYGPMEKKFPERVINVGIAEQNMMTAAAGLASVGNLVFAASYAPFTCMRALEGVRTFIAYPNLNVKVVGGLGGLSGNIEGVTHQGLEDVGIMRCIPNMTIVVPADAASTEVITEEIAKNYGPAYIRLGRGSVPMIFDENYKFQIGKANVLKASGNDAVVICNGTAVSRVLEAEKLLAEKGYDVQVVEMPCVKPIDAEVIIKAAGETGAVITAEEHNIIGGLGSAVAEVLGEYKPTLMKRLGIGDIFTESGPHDELLDKYGLAVKTIISEVENLIKSKGSFIQI